MTADGIASPSLTVHKGDWKYMSCEGDPPLLYNLREDPGALLNLSGTSAAAAVERDMRHLVASN